MAIFELNDFNYRKVTKLAPDAFITINGAFGGRVISPINASSTQDIDIQGGVTTINVNSSVNPPGSGRASIQIVAPEYTGFHTKSTSSSSGYWVTLPSGAKVPFFIPMMEVQVFMKGRYLYENKNTASKALPPTPAYYRTFWGFIVDITEDYNAGLSTMSLQCVDMLGWWKYQKLTLSPTEMDTLFANGNLLDNAFPTIFKYMNPWQVITKLLYDTQWLNSSKTDTYNFIYPKFSQTALPPSIGNFSQKDIGVLAMKMAFYWKDRFNFFGESMAVEMFGLTKPIKDKALQNLKDITLKGVDITNKSYNDTVDPDISLDYNLLARVMPFGDFDLYSPGAQSLEMTKLEIAQKLCDQTHMEFYVDMNGIMVFKPPFYNMDVTKGDIPYYIIGSGDVISYSSSINTDHIITYLELTAPRLQQTPTSVEITGFHIDWDLMLRYGLRYQKNWCQYGNDSNSLALIAAAEMARVNSEATTGHVTIPLRPEIRMGYPAYIEHKDIYYYITGMSHNFSFGSSATTDLTLTAKRERIYDATGELTAGLPGAIPSGGVVRGFVQKFRENPGTTLDLDAATQASYTKDNLRVGIDAIAVRNGANSQALEQLNFNDPDFVKKNKTKEEFLRTSQAKAGPKTNGIYELVPAEITVSSLSETITGPSVAANAEGAYSTIVSNQLLMITKTTIPYTDLRGYRHIGAFPYGANLVMRDNTIQSKDGSVSEVANDVTSNAIADPEKPVAYSVPKLLSPQTTGNGEVAVLPIVFNSNTIPFSNVVTTGDGPAEILTNGGDTKSSFGGFGGGKSGGAGATRQI